MASTTLHSAPVSPREKSLLGAYLWAFSGYVALVGVLWIVGIEALYGHPTPFYALYSQSFSRFTELLPALILVAAGWVGIHALLTKPEASRRKYAIGAIALAVGGVGACFLFGVFAWVEAAVHALPIVLLLGGIFALLFVLRKSGWPENEPPLRVRRWLVCGMVVFTFLFSGSVAMLRGGVDGISQSYERHGFEYVDDIGIGGSIRGLFRDYETIHPHLSMHAKVHPPGPIVILWILSYGVGREPLALALATMALGALAVIPLYAWVSDMFCRRVGLICAALYVVVPSIVLFTATSADITFMPITLTTLFLFWRAVHRSSFLYAIGAGIGYALMSLTSFSLVGIGAFFGLIGLLRLFESETRWGVVKTAFTMGLSALAVHAAVRYWTGFDVIAVFEISRTQFDTDQYWLDVFTPRYSSWTWKVFNPASWVFFAGIPISVLLWWRLRYPEAETKSLFLAFALTLAALDILYLARGEGERSAMYVFPFMIIPAGHFLERLGREAQSVEPLGITILAMGVQAWLMEAFLYTYW